MVCMGDRLPGYTAVMVNEFKDLVPFYVLQFVRDQLVNVSNIETFDPYRMATIGKILSNMSNNRIITSSLSTSIIDMWYNILDGKTPRYDINLVRSYIVDTFLSKPQFEPRCVQPEHLVTKAVATRMYCGMHFFHELRFRSCSIVSLNKTFNNHIDVKRQSINLFVMEMLRNCMCNITRKNTHVEKDSVSSAKRSCDLNFTISGTNDGQSI